MKSAIFKIEGMHCDGCAQTIKALIGTEPSVRAADVSFNDSQACILYDPRTVGENQLVKVIEMGPFFGY